MVVDLINFTPSGGRFISAQGPASDKEIVDAVDYRAMDLVLTALKLSGTLTVRMETALTLDAPEWQSLGVFTPLVAVKTTDRRTFHGVLRFVRWNVEALTGGDAAFSLAGRAM